MSRAMVAQFRPVGRKDTEFDRTDGWAVEMPVGSRILSAWFDGQGITCLTLEPPNGLCVPHLLYLARPHVVIEPMIGTTIGDFIKSIRMQVKDTPPFDVLLFQCSPWPTSTLAAMDAAGRG